MNSTDLHAQIAQAIIDFDMDNVENLTRQALETGIPAQDLVMGGLSAGMGVVGERYNTGEYFLPELMMCAETMKLSMAILEPLLQAEGDSNAIGTVVIGTVTGDMHDIGKNIVISMLQGAGFEVHDLGIDVPTDKFIEEVKNIKPDILGLSALLLTTREFMRNIIVALQEAGIRREVKVIVGGCPITQSFADKIGAGGYAANALDAVEVAQTVLR